jgi:hypothetical protein
MRDSDMLHYKIACVNMTLHLVVLLQKNLVQVDFFLSLGSGKSDQHKGC